MAVELRNLLGSGLELKKNLPATLLFDYPTLDAVVDYLAREVLGWEKPASEAPPPTPAKIPSRSRISKVCRTKTPKYCCCGSWNPTIIRGTGENILTSLNSEP